MDRRRGRSYEVIDDETLERLAAIARADRSVFLRGHPEYRGRLICVALCQGAALHYVDIVNGRSRPNGVKDFDVWSFFSAIPGERFPADRRNVHADFGPSKFGRWSKEPARWRHFEGRRVDLLMRAIDAPPRGNRVLAIQGWLEQGRTTSQRALGAKAVILLQPKKFRGVVAWPRTLDAGH